MADLCEVEAESSPIATPFANCAVRRSPGHPERMHPVFIPRDATAIAEPAVLARTSDDLGPARGVAAALLVSLSLWCGIALVALW